MDTASIVYLVVLIISLTFHEAAHALFAKLGGDLTASRTGQVSLNPIPHIQREPFGMLVLPILTIFMSGGSMAFGYASTPIDPEWAWRNPGKAAVMAAAGPLSNLLLALIAMLVLVFTGSSDTNSAAAVFQIANAFLVLNTVLFVFNLIPLPPLDGATVVEGLVPKARNFYGWLSSQPFSWVITMVVAWNLMKVVFPPVMSMMSDLYRALR